MAVSGLRLVRALIASQTQTWVNTSFRNVGRLGSTLGVGFAVLLFAWLTTLLTAICGVIGYSQGLAVSDGSTGITGVVFTGCSLLGPLLSVITGDAHAFDWQRLRRFPLEARWLFLAEMVAGLVHPVMLMFALGQVGLTVGLAVAEPEVLVIAIPTLLISLTIQVSARLIMGSFAEQLARNARRALLSVFVLTTVVSWQWLGSLKPKAGEVALHAHLQAAGESIDRWFQFVALSMPASLLLETFAARGWAVLSTIGLPLIGAIGVVWFAVTLAMREDGGETFDADGRPETLWSFRSPMWGVARLQWLTLWRSDLGRMALIGPMLGLWPFILAARLVSMVISSGQIDRMLGVSVWVMGALSSTNVLMNQFGFDRGTAKGLFLLPISDLEIIRGKSLGLAAFQLAQLLPVLGLSQFVLHASLTTTLSGLCTAFILFMVQLTFGQWASVTWPRPMPRKGFRMPVGSLISVSASMAINALALTPIMLIWVLVGASWPELVLPLLFTGAALTGVMQWLLAPQAAHWLAGRRERVVEALG